MEQGKPKKDSRQDVESRTRELVAPLVANEGLELLEVEFVQEYGGWILRLFIDKEGGGIGLEDCEKASKAVDTVLEVEDVIPHEYRLEVSSPGLDRPLVKPEHFKKVLGKRIKVKTYGPVSGPIGGPEGKPRKSFSGLLKAVHEDAVDLVVEGAGEFRIPLKDIAKAKLQFEF